MKFLADKPAELFLIFFSNFFSRGEKLWGEFRPKGEKLIMKKELKLLLQLTNATRNDVKN